MIPLRFPLRAPQVGVVATAMLALLLPATASAHTGDLEVGFGVGVVEFDDNVADDAGIRGDLRIGYHFSDLFQLEGQVAFANTDLDEDEILLSTAMMNGILNFHLSETVVPYLLVGIGHANLEVDFGSFIVDDDSLAYQGAVGARFFPGRGDFGLRLEAFALHEETFDDGSTHLGASLGLTWRIGGP